MQSPAHQVTMLTKIEGIKLRKGFIFMTHALLSSPLISPISAAHYCRNFDDIGTIKTLCGKLRMYFKRQKVSTMTVQNEEALAPTLFS